MSADSLQDISYESPRSGRVDLLVVAGEHSGDQQAAVMVESLLRRNPEARVCAIGGQALEEAGAQLLFDLTDSSVVGLVEVLRNYGFFKRIFAETVRWIEDYQPTAVCFVDYPGFNLRVAEELFKRGLAAKASGPVKLLYYISPQIWAWKARRRFTMAHLLDSLAVIFPFEVSSYQDTGLDVHFVGHPFVRPDYRLPVCWEAGAPTLLLPGSRKAAVGRIAPVLLSGFARYRKYEPSAAAKVICASSGLREQLEGIMAGWPDLAGAVELVSRGESEPVAAGAVLTSSGTMSLNCALAGIPGAIAYRANPVTYRIGRMLVKVPFLGIANLLLKEPMYPEYIQGAATADRLANEIRASRESPERIRDTQNAAARLREILEEPTAGDAAAWMNGQLSRKS